MTARIDDQRALPVDCLDFLVPCRRFSIRSNVTRDRQMPVVDEFVLRLIHVTERISIERVKRYFGFSQAETEIVLLDLQAHGLIALVDDFVSLTPMTSTLFRQVDEGDPPRLASVEPWSDFVWFDLVSRNMAPATRYRALPNLPLLKERPEARALPEKFARDAFQANFGDYARRIRRHPDADHLALYSISDVEVAGYGYQPLAADCGMIIHTAPELRLSFPALQDNALQFRDLTIAAADEWQRMATPDSATGVDEYERVTGDGRLHEVQRHINDPDRWMGLLQADLGSEARAIVGAAYLPANVENFCNAISVGLTRDTTASSSLLWLRPGGTRWGRTLKLAEGLQRIREVCRSGGKANLKNTLVVPRALATKARTLWRRIFDEGLLAPTSYASGNLEILLMPKVAAMILVHIPVHGGSLPVGSITWAGATLEILHRRFRNLENFQTLWTSAPVAGGSEEDRSTR
jgi:hypothetical protein